MIQHKDSKPQKFRTSKYIDFNRGVVKVQPMKLALSRATPYSLQAKLEIFECRVEVWQLGPAVNLLKELEKRKPGGTSAWAHSAYSLITMLLFYFEMIGKTLNPQSKKGGTAGRDFNYGFCDVYPKFAPPGTDFSDKNLEKVRNVRDRLRNGLYHLGGTKSDLYIHNEPVSRIPEDFCIHEVEGAQRYLVNPHSMTRTLINHFPCFMSRIRASDNSGAQLQEKFEEFFTDFHQAT